MSCTPKAPQGGQHRHGQARPSCTAAAPTFGTALDGLLSENEGKNWRKGVVGCESSSHGEAPMQPCQQCAWQERLPLSPQSCFLLRGRIVWHSTESSPDDHSTHCGPCGLKVSGAGLGAAALPSSLRAHLGMGCSSGRAQGPLYWVLEGPAGREGATSPAGG